MILVGYTRALKRYDPDLYAGRNRDGVACVFRRTKRFEEVVVEDGYRLLNLREDKQFIFSITDNWNLSGKPREWGIDHVLTHLKQIDALTNASFIEEMDRENERIDESKKRGMKNEIEAFWKHERRRFAKATDDVLTHSMSKDNKRMRLKDRSIK